MVDARSGHNTAITCHLVAHSRPFKPENPAKSALWGPIASQGGTLRRPGKGVYSYPHQLTPVLPRATTAAREEARRALEIMP